MKKQFAVAIVAIILLSVLMFSPVMSVLEDEHEPHFNLIISSVPQGADILIDGEYEGKTPKTITITDLEMHSLCLELDGYADEERIFQFEPGEEEKEMLINLDETETTPIAVPHYPAPAPVSPSEPGFLTITFILAILCGYLILKKKRQG